MNPSHPGDDHNKSSRRSFLKKTAAATLAAPLMMSLEEHALAQQAKAGAASAPASSPNARIPTCTIGNVSFSRLICGGNLIHGFAHSRDLVYVSALLKHYFNEQKIMETWSLCEQNGINTMSMYPAETLTLYRKYRAQGGRIQFLAQVSPSKKDLKTEVLKARDGGAVAAFLHGNIGDKWTKEGDVKLIGQFVSFAKDQGLVVGIAGHELRTVKAVEDAGIEPDFYMKTLHDTNYWSKQRPDQNEEAAVAFHAGFGGNYWCMNPQETIAYMAGIKRPWLAYKVLAAGAIHPKAGFHHAFQNGADFVAVGMFDFQIADDAAFANEALKASRTRERVWHG